MKDAATAALIEATAHPVPRIASWAKRQLEDMGKAVASEAVQVVDPALRADILRAYGKTRDLETARLLISYGASERAQIRLAAREAVAMLGEAGLWQLRDAYEKTVGQRAPREWPWDRVARELFAQFDRQRLSEIYALWQRGRDAEAQGDLDAARELFDRVLAWDPNFERGPAMAPTYLAFAERQAETDPRAAELAARRAERLAPPGVTRDRATSLRLTLEGRELYERGVFDEVLLQRARELDKDNHRASALEQQIRASAAQDRSEWRRYLAALVILVLGGAGVAFISARGQGPSRLRDP
jgi:tetratricopeptide (TPR) repeat protein